MINLNAKLREERLKDTKIQEKLTIKVNTQSLDKFGALSKSLTTIH